MNRFSVFLINYAIFASLSISIVISSAELSNAALINPSALTSAYGKIWWAGIFPLLFSVILNLGVIFAKDFKKIEFASCVNSILSISFMLFAFMALYMIRLNLIHLFMH